MKLTQRLYGEMEGIMAIKIIDGIRYYPVCGFEKNQHKIEYWYTKALNACYDSNWENEKALADIDEVQKMLDYFTYYTDRNGLVYAPYKDGQRIKEMITCYDLCH
jgi:hypothetical protein